MPDWKTIPPDKLSQNAYQLIQKTNNPTLNEIISLLDRANSMPTFTQNNGNSYSPSKNQVSVSPSSLTINSFAHEFTHALQQAMAQNIYNSGKENSQFKDAYVKLGQPNTERFLKTKPQTPWEEYRYSLNEAPAWGVGNTTNDDKAPVPSKPPQHLDPTLATEQAILRDLFSRYLKGKGQ